MYKNPKLQGALDSINKVRKHFELPELEKIPKGSQGDSIACPLFVALAPCGVIEMRGYLKTNNPRTAKEIARVLGTSWHSSTARVVELNSILSDFIFAFDFGSYPWLVLKDGPKKK